VCYRGWEWFIGREIDRRKGIGRKVNFLLDLAEHNKTLRGGRTRWAPLTNTHAAIEGKTKKRRS